MPRLLPSVGFVEPMLPTLVDVPCISLEEAPPDRKMILASRSFGRRVTMRRELEEAVTTHTARAAEKLRRQDLACGRLTVFVTTDKHRPQDRQYTAERSVTLPVASADTGKLNHAAMRALDALWRPGLEYKKAGVMLLNLAAADTVQGGLFDRPDDQRAIARMRALDSLNARYGRGNGDIRRHGAQAGLEAAQRFHLAALHDGVGRPVESVGRPRREPRRGRQGALGRNAAPHVIWERSAG